MTHSLHNPGADSGGQHLCALLDAMPVGVLTVSRRGTITQCNRLARQLLEVEGDGLPDLPLLAGVEPVAGAADRALLRLVSGTTLTLTAQSLPGGGALVRLEPAARPTAAMDDYLSLFDNAVHGIYRDTLDGRPIRANQALARLNGYATETEYLAAVGKAPGNWYVDPGRAAEFQRLLKRDGHVHDFVSQVYRHRSREIRWISENAWYVRDASGVPQFIEGTIQDATDRVESLSIIERQANTDALTGTASRFRFLRELGALTRDDTAEGVLLIIDLDKFKEVNDLFGHGAGDTVLKTVAERLQPLGGRHTLLARLGGDEFAMLLTGHHCHMMADTVAAEVVKALRQPIDIDGHIVKIGASVGVAIYPAQAATAEELLTHADMALYQVKAMGRNDFRLFDPELKARADRRKALEAELSDAIRAGELELLYQPIVRTADKSTAGFEALMRWNHPRRGRLLPAHFIDVAEDSGLMTELGNWAIRQACQQAVLMPPALFVAVNVSPSQISSPGIVGVVRRALEDTGLAAGRLKLEVTETAILSREATATKVIDALLNLGVGLALDDFGTGYGSLSYLQRFAFSKIKIDRSFIASLDTQPANLAITRAVIGLARDLGIHVVAEGVETEAQAAILEREGCVYLQGYLFGKPRSFRDTIADLAANRLRTIVPGAPAAEIGPLRRTVHKRW